MLTLYPTFKQVSGGYMPIVNIRGARGQMRGCRAPYEAAKPFQVHKTPELAVCEAYRAALIASLNHPSVLRVA